MIYFLFFYVFFFFIIVRITIWIKSTLDKIYSWEFSTRLIVVIIKRFNFFFFFFLIKYLYDTFVIKKNRNKSFEQKISFEFFELIYVTFFIRCETYFFSFCRPSFFFFFFSLTKKRVMQPMTRSTSRPNWSWTFLASPRSVPLSWP